MFVGKGIIGIPGEVRYISKRPMGCGRFAQSVGTSCSTVARAHQQYRMHRQSKITNRISLPARGARRVPDAVPDADLGRMDLAASAVLDRPTTRAIDFRMPLDMFDIYHEQDIAIS
jgi:hypothetical protein